MEVRRGSGSFGGWRQHRDWESTTRYCSGRRHSLRAGGEAKICDGQSEQRLKRFDVRAVRPPWVVGFPPPDGARSDRERAEAEFGGLRGQRADEVRL
jgi:hypothetical protein